MSNSDFIDRFWEIVRNCWDAICKVVLGYVDESSKATAIEYDPAVTFTIAAVMLVLFGSACWAASIAKCRRYNPIPHFLLGLIIPWVYPLIILFALDIKGVKEMRAKAEAERLAKEAEEAERQKNIALNMGAEAQEQPEEEDSWNQAYFEKIARASDGSSAGPWLATYGGNTIRVLSIIEALPEVVNVEFEGEKGKPMKIRIPYAKIEAWEKE